MNYEQIYNDLIQYRKCNKLLNGYYEKHHIIPRSLGGSDECSNIVALTGREHYIAHLLLARFEPCKQTIYALWMMQMSSGKNSDRPCIKTGRMYEWARKEFIKYISKNSKITSKGERNSQYGTRWICNSILRQNRKIELYEEIPVGWSMGRNNWNKPEKKHSTPKKKSITISQYIEDPKRCKQCDIVILYTKRTNLFCCRSCKASYTNKHRWLK